MLFLIDNNMFVQTAYAATTQLIEMPGDWIEQIATSSVPLFSSLATPIFWLVGVGVVGFIISKLLGIGR